MANTPVPHVSRGWIVAIYAPFLCAWIWVSWTGMPPIAAILSTALALIVAAACIQQMSTTLSLDGVSQLTPTGRVHLSWLDVARVTLGDKGKVLLESTDGTRIYISPMFYTDFDATRRWVAGRVPHAWPTDTR